MTGHVRGTGFVTALAVWLWAVPAGAQQHYRLSFEARMRSNAYRGVRLDSVSRSSLAVAASGGLISEDGIAVRCVPGFEFCTMFRPGPIVRATPVELTADIVYRGVGIPGLSLHALARAHGTVTGSSTWPESDPNGRLVQGGLTFSRNNVVMFAGRNVEFGRFGPYGYDGGKLELTRLGRSISIGVYGGRGFGRATDITFGSNTLNPLGDFVPGRRQIIGGARLQARFRRMDVSLEYLHEIDPTVDKTTVQKIGGDVALRLGGVTLTGGLDYDIALDVAGTAEAAVTAVLLEGKWWGSVGFRRYRPTFPLWSVWEAFSPVPYTAVSGSTRLLLNGLRLEARGELYEYDDAAVLTPLVSVENHGWRGRVAASYTLPPGISIAVSNNADFGPGAAQAGAGAAVSFQPSDRLELESRFTWSERTLEYRFDDATIRRYAVTVRMRPSPAAGFDLTVAYRDVSTDRPDLAVADFDRVTVRAGFRITWTGTRRDLARVLRAIPEGDGVR